MMYFRGTLDKLGVQADIVRIGEYKASPEMFQRRGPSDPAREQMDRYLDVVYAHLLDNLAEDRGLADAEAAKKTIEQGPFTAKEALATGLADRLVPADIVDEELKQLAGGSIVIDERYGTSKLRHRRYLDAPAVAVVHITGTIVRGKSTDMPLLDMKTTGAETITEILRKLRNDARVRVVLLRIDSPGGDSLASEMIWREVMALRREKPIIASMGAVAASGGYYIASAADEIFAESTTLTGSIGIWAGKADVSGLLDKLGIDTVTFKRGAHADIMSWTRPYTDEERRSIMFKIREFYDLFRDRIVEGRANGLTREMVDELGRGRIWSGEDAQSRLLVDHIGGYLEALKRARALGRVPADTRVFHLPKPRRGLLFRLASSMQTMLHQPSPLDALLLTPKTKQLLRAAYPFVVTDANTPRAMLPFVIVEE
jgi:protease-4